MIVYHGTEAYFPYLKKGSYVTTEFELAASYALRNDSPVVLVVETTALVVPEEPAYDTELLATDDVVVVSTYRPRFNHKPNDWYELNETLTERKYPALFDEKNWSKQE